MILITLCFFLAAADQNWTVDALMDIKTIHDPQITADGAKVAYTVRHVDPANNRYVSTIWIRSVQDGVAHAIAQSHFTDSTPRWSPDGVQIAFLSRRTGLSQIHVAKGNSLKQLTFSPTPVESFRWSADGQRLAYIAQEPFSAEQKERNETGHDAIVAGQFFRNSKVWMIQLRDQSVQKLPIEKHILSVDWSSDGSKLVYSAQNSSSGAERFHSDLFEFDLKKQIETALVKQPGQDLFPSYSPDGKYIAFYSQRGTLSYFGERQIGIVPSGGGPVRYVSESLDADVFGGASKFWWSKDSKTITFGAGKGTKDYVFSLTVDTGRSELLFQQISGTSSFSVSDDGSNIAWIRAQNGVAPDLYLRDTRTSKDTQLTDLNPQIKRFPSVRAETVRWKSSDGLNIEGVLRLPFKYQSGKSVPLLTIIHGGPTGASLENFPIPRLYPIQLFLAAGYAIFEPNFRGSINYGPAFRLPTIQQQGYGDMSDIMSGIDSLVEKGIADPNRLGVLGWSYGGFMSSWMVGHTDRFKAASIGACAMDWTTYYGMSIGIDDAPPEVVREYFGGTPWDRFEAYDRHSPRFHLKNVKTPSLLLRGERDLDTMSEMYVALKELNVPVTFVTYPREPHGIGEPVHQRDLLNRNLEWFQKWIPVQ